MILFKNVKDFCLLLRVQFLSFFANTITNKRAIAYFSNSFNQLAYNKYSMRF